MASETQIEEPPQMIMDTYFNDASDTDIILRSSDNVEFYTHRLLLSLASPVFKGMFTLPQNHTMESDLPGATQHIIPMAENSCALRHFLTWCDPRTEFVCDKWADIDSVLRLADKYDVIALQNSVKKTIMSSFWVHANPLSVYAIAIKYRFDALAARAARSSLKLSLGESLSAPEMGSISAIDFHDLLRYHHKCSRKAVEATKDLSWMQPGAKGPFERHREVSSYSSNCCSSSNSSRYPEAGTLGVVTWLHNHLTLAGQLLLDQPAGKTVEQLSLRLPEKWEPFKQAAACDTCRSTWRYNISRFNTDLSAEIEKRIGTVAFEFTSVPFASS